VILNDFKSKSQFKNRFQITISNRLISNLTQHCDNHTYHQSFLNLCKNFAAISKFHRKGQIPRLGSKFHGLRKTVGLTDMYGFGMCQLVFCCFFS